MWFETTHVILTSGYGTGIAEIVAFDGALRAASIADFNLIRVTSIVPPRVPVMRLDCSTPLDGRGLMLPAVYSAVSSDHPAQTVTAAVGVGIPEDREKSGVIFTHGGVDLDSEQCRGELETFIAEGMKALRRLDSYSCEISCTSTPVPPDGGWTTAMAALCFADESLWSVFQSSCRPA